MRQSPSRSAAGRQAVFQCVLLWLACLAALSARAQSPREIGDRQRPSHVDLSDDTYQTSTYLPVDLRRVAVLPPGWQGSEGQFADGCEMLAPILSEELINTRKFEVVTVRPEALRRLTGRLSWTGAEVLPADFLGSLQRVYGCDAVLFCELSAFRAYAPLAVGWRLKLVDTRTGEIIWATDKLFDAADRGTLNQAQHEGFCRPWFLRDDVSDWSTANSPREFGRFSICEALASLPKRQKTVKVLASVADVTDRH